MRVTISRSGPPPGLHKDDDDDDEGGIPQEVLDMIRMTEMMSSRSGFGGLSGGPGMHIRRIGGAKPKEPVVPRHEESIENIMDRMNKLSDDIGE